MSQIDKSESEIFIEQAEYLSNDSFKEWSTSIHNEKTILKKLSSSGAKLISGPRGSGKTTLLLKLYNKLLEPDSNIFPIYVNFKSSLKLEPLYRTTTNAGFWFNQWLIYKVYEGLAETIEKGAYKKLDTILSYEIQQVVSCLELGDIENIKTENKVKRDLELDIESLLKSNNKNRCILLLDDAGHAFSTEQQHDFFEFFREIKSKTIAPKAAVYPGVTSYSTSFHIGHDAEEIDVWVRPNSEGYIDFMHSLLKTRLGDESFNELKRNEDYLSVLCYAAYGIPRSLLNMVSELQESSTSYSLDNKSILKVIKNNFDRTYQIFDTLRIKLPMYANFIDQGADVYEKCLTINKEFNKNNTANKQSSIIAIKRPLSNELTKVLGFFQYAGLISDQGISNRGGKGVYELYELHYSSIIDRNVFFSSRGISFKDYSNAFANRPNHHYPRHMESGILPSQNVNHFSLALPPCPKCNSARFSEDSKFCSNCGVKLKNASIFESIVSQDITKLPITNSRAQSIIEGSNITTIKDILLDSDNRQLFKVKMVGPVWAKRIKSYAEEFIA